LTVYRSPTPYDAGRINAAAVYCSDGRIGDQIDDFLHQGLSLPRYDRLACPGGPAALAGRLLAFWEARGIEEQLRFLIRVHAVSQVVLIAHAGCAYYRERLGIGPATAESEQSTDLHRAGAAVQRIEPTIQVAAFFALVEGAEVSFERVFASEAIDTRLRRGRGVVRV
jgi:Putative carbonic anhydrase